MCDRNSISIKYDRIKKMTIDEKTFFREATLRICGSLEIHKALGDFFIYVKNFIPTDRIIMGLFDLRSGFMETIADAIPAKSEALSAKYPVSPKLQKLILERWPLKQVRVFHPMGDHEITRQMALTYGTTNRCCVILALVVEGNVLGMLAIIYAAKEKNPCKDKSTFWGY